MKDKQYHLPVFPIPVFLLPEGVTRLRIFEPRYLKMVGIASKEQGFIIYYNETKTKHHEKTNQTTWGSWVEIINFNQGKDGLLEIDVRCKTLVKLHTLTLHNKDNLHYADVTLLKHWSTDNSETSNRLTGLTNELSESLTKVIRNNAMLNELYPQIAKENTVWVIARWLELLPIEQVIKPIFIQQYSFEQAKQFVQSIIHH